MRKITNVLFLAGAIALLAVGCGGKKVANDPKAVVTAFFAKLAAKDFDGAAKLATKDSKTTLDMMKKGMEAAEKMGELGKDKDSDPTEEFKKMTFGEPKITGDNATVPVTAGGEKGTKDIPLKKEDGSWKVDFSMSTLQKMKDNDGADNGFDTPVDTDANTDIKMSADSLEEALKKAKEVMDQIKPEDIEKAKEVMEKMKEN